MTPKQPPVVATWLLRHLGCSPNNEAVLGDLAEEYSRKGAMWYWRQVLKAIPVSAFRELVDINGWPSGRLWLASCGVDCLRRELTGPSRISFRRGLTLIRPCAGIAPSIERVSGVVVCSLCSSSFVLKPSNPVVFVPLDSDSVASHGVGDLRLDRRPRRHPF